MTYQVGDRVRLSLSYLNSIREEYFDPAIYDECKDRIGYVVEAESNLPGYHRVRWDGFKYCSTQRGGDLEIVRPTTFDLITQFLNDYDRDPRVFSVLEYLNELPSLVIVHTNRQTWMWDHRTGWKEK